MAQILPQGPQDEDSMATNAIPGSNKDHPMYVKLVHGRAIRLVHLLPGSEDDSVKIQLSIHELEHHPDYEALSYVWGPTQDPESWTTIDCNGKRLWITKSLHSAFRRVRLPDRSRTVWADAVCINQQDDDEKSHHVAFMNRIYSHASDVLVCMSDPPSISATENIKLLLEEHARRREGFPRVNDMPILEGNDPLLKDPRWNSLGKLVQDVWYSRAWVLQETGVAKHATIYWGDSQLSYREVMHMARWVVRCAPQLQTSAEISLLTIHTDWSDWTGNWRADQPVTRYSVVDFLSQAKGLMCGKAHDHVYALLGHPLLQQKDPKGETSPILEPDYSKDMTEIFLEFTKKILPQAGIKLLSAVEHDERSLEAGIPSWVVRWDMDIIQNSLGYYPEYYYRASGPEPESSEEVPAALSIKGNECICRALRVDTILLNHQFPATEEQYEVAKVSQALGRSNNVVNEVLDKIFNSIQKDETPSKYSKAQRTDALSLTLCTGLTSYNRAESDLQTHRANFEAFLTARAEALGRPTAPTSEDALTTAAGQNFIGKADTFWYDMCLGCKGRCFFVTMSGYYGLGPWILEPGDECWILKGARTPFVLRPISGERSFRLLGEAYIHGIMHGEFVELLGEEVAWETVVLK
ncbi:hypothetical protein H2200_007873 [Cladophialophora chaetospira]|uniref:Heterokaryon incompatibility domain-containing protein n=1 Tax=Cladophialophora chaetospira TaxID=386627 RepID=A0AA38X6N3_9EURO|nr:hypothetical protein H2200_007873 [Cladophialophora chaetospira]